MGYGGGNLNQKSQLWSSHSLVAQAAEPCFQLFHLKLFCGESPGDYGWCYYAHPACLHKQLYNLVGISVGGTSSHNFPSDG
jgi:hypothetical protein